MQKVFSLLQNFVKALICYTFVVFTDKSLNNCLKNSTQLTTFNVKVCDKILQLDLYLTLIWTFYAIIPKASFITDC